MKTLKKEQGGFFTMIALILTVLITVIVFVYLRVARANS